MAVYKNNSYPENQTVIKLDTAQIDTSCTFLSNFKSRAPLVKVVETLFVCESFSYGRAIEETRGKVQIWLTTNFYLKVVRN